MPRTWSGRTGRGGQVRVRGRGRGRSGGHGAPQGRGSGRGLSGENTGGMTAAVISSSRGRGRGRGISVTAPEWLYLGLVDDLPVGIPLEIPLTPKRRRIWTPESNSETADLTMKSATTSAPSDVDSTAGTARSEVYSTATSARSEAGTDAHFIAGLNMNMFSQRPALFLERGVSSQEASRASSSISRNSSQTRSPSINNSLASSPAAFVECGGNGLINPRSRPHGRRNTVRDDEIVDDLSNKGSEEDDSDEEDITTFTPRGMRIYVDHDEEMPNTEPVFAWPPQTQTHEIESIQSPAPSSSTHDGSEGDQFGPTDLFSFEWRPLPRPPIPPESRRETFSEKVGSTITTSDPYEAFSAIWSTSIINHIVVETNKYAEQLIVQQIQSESLRDDSRIASWSDIDADDLMVFLAIVMAMSIVQKNVLSDYWNKDQNIFTTPMFSVAMPRNKFQRIFRCLHFNDNSQLPTRTSAAEAKIYKLDPIIQHLNRKFAEIYKLGQNISLDESLTHWKGPLCIKQCIPNKAAKVGIKTYEVCDSKTGYLYRFECHAKGAEPLVTASDSPIFGFFPRLVLRLLQGLENKGHCIWMDNFYNSPALARVLKTMGFDCVGTLRTNRSFVPVQLNQIKSGQLPLRKGELVGCTSGDIDLFVWHDTIRVAFISTYHGMTVHHCSVENKTKPILVRDYNVSMGGVDKKDQILSAYPIERKRLMVWYKKLFFRLLNVSILNASVVFNTSPHMVNQPKMAQKQFRCKLVLSMLARHNKLRPVLKPLSTQCTRILPQDAVSHFTIGYETRGSSNERLRRSCVVCKTRVRTHCPTCQVALCLSPCAQQYHTTE